jgi:hypothetical protein
MWKQFSVFAVALLATIGITTPAWAGPVVIIGAVLGAAVGAGAVAAGVIAGSIIAAAAIGAVVGAAAGALLGDGLMGGFDTPTFESNELSSASAENQGILLDKQGTLEYIPVVYGKRMVSGTRVFVSTNGENNKYLYLAVVLCEGEIESIDEVFFDDVLSTDKMYKGRHKIEKFRGTDNQSASSLLSEAPAWGSNHRLQGLAYLAVRLEWKKIESNEDARQNPFSGIPRIKCIVKGSKIPDAQTAGSVSYYSETMRYSANPADHLLDYLRNPRYGKGLENSRINFSSFATASQKFNQTVRYHLSGHTGPMMTSNAVIDTKRKLMDNVKIFLNNMRCGMPYVQGQFKLKLLDTGNGSDAQNTTVTSVFDITTNELTNGIQIEGTSTRNQFNQVLVTHPSPGQNWELSEVTYPVPDSQEDVDYLAEDSGRRLQKTISLPHITEPALAGDLAHIILKRSRGKKTITFKTTAECHEVEVGDVVTITYAPLGFSSAKYRIQSMKVEPDYTISFQAVEHEPAEYVFRENNFVAVAPKVYYSPYTPTPPPAVEGSHGNSSVTETFLAEQAANNSPYVPLAYINPTVNSNGVIDTAANTGSALTATSIARRNRLETFKLQWTPPNDVSQYFGIVISRRWDSRGQTEFFNLLDMNDATATELDVEVNTGVETYTYRVIYRTFQGQISNPLQVQLTSGPRYATADYVSGVNVFNGTIVEI